jgi:integrase
MPRPKSQPAYRYHKARNCAVVTIDGRNHYLGPWQSPESHEKYAALIAERQRSGTPLPGPIQVEGTSGSPTPLSVNELLLAYFTFAQTHYVKNGEPTSEQGCIRQALRFVRKLYGTTSAADFGPRALKNVREAMVAVGRSRKSINKDVHRIKRMVRWAVEEELLPPEVYSRLRCVAPLAKGKTTARETGKVLPVPEGHVEAVLPHLPPPVAAMVQLQLLTGTRPQEVMHLRPGDLTAGDGVWYYSPSVHKTEHLGKEKCVVLGPRAMAVLQSFLDRDPGAFCFSPAEAVVWQRARSRKRTDSDTRVRVPIHDLVNPRYTRHSYRVAVQRACRRAGIPVWTPRQLRHTRATQIRHEFGTIEAAKAVLGHADTRVTEIYAERDIKLAEQVMRRIG